MEMKSQFLLFLAVMIFYVFIGNLEIKFFKHRKPNNLKPGHYIFLGNILHCKQSLKHWLSEYLKLGTGLNNVEQIYLHQELSKLTLFEHCWVCVGTCHLPVNLVKV